MLSKEKLLNDFYDNKERLMRILLSVLGGDKEAAEDVFQELALSIFIKQDQFESVVNLSAYFSEAARNKAVDYLRKNAKVKFIELESLPNTLYDGDAIASLKKIEDDDFAYHLLADWEPKYREAFIQFIVDGYSLKQIAKSLDTTEKALSNKFKRLIKKTKNKNHLLLLIILLKM